MDNMFQSELIINNDFPASDWNNSSNQISSSPFSSTTQISNQNGFTQTEIKPISFTTYLKLAYLIIILVSFFLGAYFLFKKIFFLNLQQNSGDILLRTAYQPVLWKDFGEVFEPMIKIPLSYPDGYEEKEFLLDSGALVSSLPREEAKKMGLNLAMLPRSTFGGYGNTISFAYKSEAKIKLGEMEVKIPIVFTEAAGTKPIIGRSGFFEKFSIFFNSRQNIIEIRK